MWQRENLHKKTDKECINRLMFKSLYTVSMVIETKVVIG